MIEKARRPSRPGVAASVLLVLASLSACKPKPADIRLKQNRITLYGLKKVEVLQADVVDRKGQPVSGAAVTWTSANPKVASVEGSGVLKAVGPGKTKVTASCPPLSAVVNVEVVDVATITVNPGRTTLAGPAGSKTLFTAEAKDSKGTLVELKPKWSVGDAKIASIGPDGVVTSIAQGRTTVSASLGDVVGVSDLTVVFREIASFDVSPTTLIMKAGETQRLNAAARDAGGTAIDDVAVDWSSSDARVARCTGGTVTAVSKGSATIKGSCAGKTIEVTVLVN